MVNNRSKEIERIITPTIKEKCPYIDEVFVRRHGKRDHFGRKPYEVLLGLDINNLGEFDTGELSQYVKNLGKYILFDEEWFINTPFYDKFNYHYHP
jgi:hypothetical protein